jgi:SAM-dependent MidA family methyltransferase
MAGPVAQREVLLALGFEALDASLQERHRDALDHKMGALGVSLLSRRQALRALVDRGGLGAFGVVVGWKGIEPPPFLAAAQREPAGMETSSIGPTEEAEDRLE